MASNGRPPTPPAPNSEAMKELLAMMTSTLQAMGQSFDTMSGESTRIATLGPAMDSAHEIDQLRKQMRAQEKKQDQRIASVKHLVTDVLKDEISNMLKDQVDEQIAKEISLQVDAEVKSQLPSHLPVPLDHQAAESHRQLKDVRSTLINAESRRANAALRASSLEDPLATIVKPNGEESSLFPKNLGMLFRYDNDKAKRLLQDYGLREADSREANINKFMGHCGIQFHLIPVPVGQEAGINALGISLSSS